MERLYAIILLTIINVFEIILLLNRAILPYELIVILMFLVLVFMMLFMLNKRYFWDLTLLAFILSLINIAYLALVFGLGVILYMSTALAVVGIILSLVSLLTRPRMVRKKPVRPMPREEPRKAVEIEKEIRGITLDKPRVIIEEYKPVEVKVVKTAAKPAKKASKKFVASAKAKTFHTTKCDWADNIKKKNKVFFGTRKSAEKAGLEPHSCVDPNYKPKPKKKKVVKKAAKKVVKKSTRKRAPYVASSSAKTYHNLKCDWSNNIKKKNKVTFNTRKTAEKAGFVAHSCIDPNYKPKPKKKKVVKKVAVKKVVAKKKVLPFVASTKAKTYHTAKCNWADNIKRVNKIRFSSRKKAEDLGLKPHECVTGKKVVPKRKKAVKKRTTKKAAKKKVKQVKKTYKPGKYVASTNGGVYHAGKCKWADNIDRKNRVWFSSRQKAEKLGYKAHSCLKQR